MRGATPITTNETTSMTPTVVRIVGQRSPSYQRRISSVTRTTALVSQKQPQEERGVEVAGAVVEQRHQAPGAGTALADELLGAGAGVRRERGVGGGEDAREDDQDGCQHQPCRAPGRVAHPSARQAASSWSWSPNISACSSGSAWS